MANAIERFFGKVFSTIFTYTIGLVLPWWIVEPIASNGGTIESYESKTAHLKKFHRYTYGLILPWWTLSLLAPESNKSYNRAKGMGARASAASGSRQISEAEKRPKEVKFKCRGCGLTIKCEPNGNYPKSGHIHERKICPNPTTGGSVYLDRKYHQFSRDYS